jgi:serine/threonine protein kinase
MTPERWQRVKELFETTLKLDADARGPFLERACEGDEGLVKEVESLLVSHEESRRFLESPAVAVMAESLVDDPSAIVAGQRIRNYEVLSKISEGGMGEVYLARDLRSGHNVAIKLIRREFRDQREQLRYFKREAKAIAAMNHPNVCRRYEIGATDDGQPFIAMEYVEGMSLTERLKSRPHKTGEIIDIAIQVADALHEAHSHGIIHRDIKPANIMITPHGRVKVLDFGLARIVTSASDPVPSDASTAIKTASGVVLGTIVYMSPEQALGEDVDHRTDIFSLGAVLYEMHTGKRPFASDTFGKTIEKIAQGQMESTVRFDCDTPAELERIIRKCIAKDRQSRYHSAYELAMDLNDLRKALDDCQGHRG